MRPQPRADPEMLAIIAVVLFVIAFILNAAGNQRQRDFLAVQLMLTGRACLALQLAGAGAGWRARR
ncbi:MAG: hypothetical protein ACTHJW_22525 [Streptosporangiaceae bacterium]